MSIFSNIRPIVTHLGIATAQPGGSYEVVIYGRNFNQNSRVVVDKYNDLSAAGPPILTAYDIDSPTQITAYIDTDPVGEYQVIFKVLSGIDSSSDWSRDLGAGFLTISATPGPNNGGMVELYMRGEHVRYFPTVTSAMVVADSNSIIVAGPGLYQENIIMKDGVRLHGKGAIFVSPTNQSCITLGETSVIAGLTIVTPTGGMAPSVVFSGNTFALVQDCTFSGGGLGKGIENNGTGYLAILGAYFGGAGHMAMGIANTGGGIIKATTLAVFAGAIDQFIYTLGGEVEINDVSVKLMAGSSVGSAVYVAGGQLVLSDASIGGATNGIHIATDGVTLNLSSVRVRCTNDFRTAATCDGTGTIVMWSGDSAKDRWLVENPTFYANADCLIHLSDNVMNGERAMNIDGGFGVGSIEHPSHSSFGGGISYTRGMKVITWDSTNGYVDISDIAGGHDNGTFTFSANEVGAQIWVGSERRHAGGDYHKFPGIRTDVVTPAVYGAGTIGLYRDDNLLDPLRYSVINASGNRHYGKMIANEVQYEQIRFDPGLDAGWQKEDGPLYSPDLYWVCFQIDNDVLTTLPVFNQFKLHTDASHIEEDGFPSNSFGKARVQKSLAWDYGLAEGATTINGGITYGSPSAGDVFLSDGIGVGRVNNAFVGSANDAVGFNAIFPFDIDTSDTVKVIFKYFTNSNGGNIVLNCSYGWTYDGTGVYNSTAVAPPTGTYQQPTIRKEIIGVANSYTQQTVVFDLDVSAVQVRPTDDISKTPVFWVTIGRPASSDPVDTATTTVYGLQINAIYTAFAMGGHL